MADFKTDTRSPPAWWSFELAKSANRAALAVCLVPASTTSNRHLVCIADSLYGLGVPKDSDG